MPHGPQFIGVRDSRNRRVPGLYVRNGLYYGQLWVDREDGRKTASKFALLDARGTSLTALVAAKEAMEVLSKIQRENALPATGHKPRLSAYFETHFSKSEGCDKKRRTLESQRQAVKRWQAHLGSLGAA